MGLLSSVSHNIKNENEPLVNRITNLIFCIKSQRHTAKAERVNGIYSVHASYVNDISLCNIVHFVVYSKKYCCTSKMNKETISPCVHMAQAMLKLNKAISDEYFSNRKDNLNV